jgi:hypothetical protein
MSDPSTARIEEISERLGELARRLKAAEPEDDEATRLAEECAELASQAAAELDRLVRASPQDSAPGQEELL